MTRQDFVIIGIVLLLILIAFALAGISGWLWPLAPEP